jgi:hypothetical protein
MATEQKPLFSANPSQPMNDQNHSETRRQELSALMDGELSHDRAQFALKSITEDAAVAAQWDRLHFLRHYLREAEVQPVTADFLAGVRARLASEEQPRNRADSEFADWAAASVSRPEGGFWSGWRQQAAGLAVAASVTMLALFGFNTLILQPGEPLPSEAAGIAAGPSTNAGPGEANDGLQVFTPRGNVLQDQFSATAIPVNYTEGATDFRQQLNDYMLRHSQLASGSGRVGFAAYAPLLSADVQLTNGDMPDADMVSAAINAPVESDQVQAGPLVESSQARR